MGLQIARSRPSVKQGTTLHRKTPVHALGSSFDGTCDPSRLQANALDVRGWT
jgi:hypothetical protein